MKTRRFSKREAIGFGWDKMKGSFWLWVGIIVSIYAASLIPTIVFILLGQDPEAVPDLYWPLQIAVMILTAIMGMGMVKIIFKIHDGQKPAYIELFTTYRPFFRYLFASILFGLAVGLGFILLIVPGIIVAIRLQFYQFLIIDQDMGIMDSLKKSWAMTKGSSWNLFFFYFVMFGVVLLGLLALGIGLFAALPVTWIAWAYIYRKLLQQADEAPVFPV